jgi:hypothetical protein
VNFSHATGVLQDIRLASLNDISARRRLVAGTGDGRLPSVLAFLQADDEAVALVGDPGDTAIHLRG